MKWFSAKLAGQKRNSEAIDFTKRNAQELEEEGEELECGEGVVGEEVATEEGNQNTHEVAVGKGKRRGSQVEGDGGSLPQATPQRDDEGADNWPTVVGPAARQAEGEGQSELGMTGPEE